MNKYKTLAGNTLIFGICNFTSKLLVFLMLPFYTTYMSKAEFGTADLLTTTVSLLQPFLTLGIAEACLRFALDRNYDIKQVFSLAWKIILCGFLMLILCLPAGHFFANISNYLILFYILFVTTILDSFFNYFSRGLERVKILGIAGVVSSFTAVAANIIFLFVFRMGVTGYIMAYILAHTASCSVLFFGSKMYNYFTLKTPTYVAKDMLSYSLPLVPNKLSWWLNHSVNRYILNIFCGVADVGLYSVAARMPTIVDTFRGIFIEAWQLSMITEYDKKDSISFFSNIYRVYNVFLILFCSILIILSQILATILYAKDFFEAWIYTPLLILGVFYGSLVAFYSPIYLSYKKTNKLFIFTMSGAIMTIVLNLILVPIIGIHGAAVTSALSYFTIFLGMAIDSKKYVRLNVKPIRYYISYGLLSIQAFLVAFSCIQPVSIISLLITMLLILINVNEIKDISQILIKFLNKKFKSK